MRCNNCGSRIPEGKLYCPFCGEEVQLVPEYLSADMQREKLRLIRQEEERIRREREMAAIARLKENRLSPFQRTLCVSFSIVFGAVLIYCAFTALRANGMKSYGYLKTMAVRAVGDGDGERAMRFIKHAESVMPDSSVDLAVMEAEILHGEHDTEGALRILCTALTRSNSIRIYNLLISYLEEEKRYKEAAQLISESGLPELIEKYPYYRVSPPAFSLAGDAVYSHGTLLTISSEDPSAIIYYTTDGSDADESGLRFEEALLPEAGINRINAVCVNEHGIMSEQVSVVFEIRGA